jgi:hypothetical protein
VAFPLGGGSRFLFQYLWIIALFPLVMLAPNTQEILGRFQPALDFRREVSPASRAAHACRAGSSRQSLRGSFAHARERVPPYQF